MRHNERKAAIAACKLRTATAGIYAVRCASSGQVWVGRAPDIDCVPNRLWFTLRAGTDPHRSLQDAWTAHGAGSFTFEVLERLEDEALPYIRQALLKERLARWRARLAATAI